MINGHRYQWCFLSGLVFLLFLVHVFVIVFISLFWSSQWIIVNGKVKEPHALIQERESGDWRVYDIISGSYFPQSLTTSGSRTWLAKTLARCVSSQFHVPANLPGICWHTLEKSCTYVNNARSLSVKLALWSGICWHTTERCCTNVPNATNHSVLLINWRGTSLSMPE